MNLRRFALLVACLAALAGCDFRQGAKGGKGGGGGGALPESIDGTYLIHAMNYFGEIRLPDDVAERMQMETRKVVFADGQMTTNMHGGPQTYDMTIDRTKSPAQVTFTRTDKDGKTETTYGVMAILGGQLTVCRYMGRQALKPEDRPTEIRNGENYLTLKLKKES